MKKSIGLLPEPFKSALERLPLVFIRIEQIAAAAFGMALGAINLARLYMTVFAPIVCH